MGRHWIWSLGNDGTLLYCVESRLTEKASTQASLNQKTSESFKKSATRCTVYQQLFGDTNSRLCTRSFGEDGKLLSSGQRYLHVTSAMGEYRLPNERLLLKSDKWFL